MGRNRTRNQIRLEEKHARKTGGHDSSKGKPKFQEEREERARLNRLVPMNKKQEGYLRALEDDDVNVIIATGLPGSSKTYISTAYACLEFLRNRVYKIAFSRPAISNSKSLGFFAGPQPLTSKVLTVEGFKTIEEIKVGDFVATPSGTYAKVKAVSYHPSQNVYKLKTNKGQETLCSEDHLWKVQSINDRKHKKDFQLLRLKEILFNEKPMKHGNLLQWSLPSVEPVEFLTKNFTIDPYVLGAYLGDGSCSLNSTPSLSSTDPECIEAFNKNIENLGCKLSFPKQGISYSIIGVDHKERNNKVSAKYFAKHVDTNEIHEFTSRLEASKFLNYRSSRLGDKTQKYDVKTMIGDYLVWKEPSDELATNPFKKELGKLNLIGIKAWDKFIPEEYLLSSREQRLEILRGLLDTDGWCTSGRIGFSTTSPHLRDGVSFLVRSLGGTVTVNERDRREESGRTRKDGGEIYFRRVSYELGINLRCEEPLFKISRKEEQRVFNRGVQRVFIESIEFDSVQDCKCITLDNEEGMYITDDFIPTHNSANEKMTIWLAPVLSTVKQYLGAASTEIAIREEDIVFYPLEIIKGLSLGSVVDGKKMYFIVDEAEDLTKDEVIKIVTRIGKNCKLILAGDLAQSELKENSGLKWLVEFYQKHNLKSFYHVDFDHPNDIVRSDVVKNFIVALKRDERTKE